MRRVEILLYTITINYAGSKDFLEPAVSKSKAFEDNLFRSTGVIPLDSIS
jgi:hypothetical protein